jgi:hypothetical protein
MSFRGHVNVILSSIHHHPPPLPFSGSRAVNFRIKQRCFVMLVDNASVMTVVRRCAADQKGRDSLCHVLPHRIEHVVCLGKAYDAVRCWWYRIGRPGHGDVSQMKQKGGGGAADRMAPKQCGEMV